MGTVVVISGKLTEFYGIISVAKLLFIRSMSEKCLRTLRLLYNEKLILNLQEGSRRVLTAGVDPHFTVANVSSHTEKWQPQIFNLTILECSLDVGVEFMT